MHCRCNALRMQFDVEKMLLPKASSRSVGPNLKCIRHKSLSSNEALKVNDHLAFVLLVNPTESILFGPFLLI